MRALVYTESRDLVVREVDAPVAGAGEVVVRVEAAGICASDVHALRSRSERRTPPLIMGHELIGGTRPGGFAQLVAVPRRCLHRLADGTDAATAVFAEPLATCLHGLALAPDRFAATAVVLGGGTIGTLAAQLLRVSGAQHVVVSEPLPERHASLRAVADAVVAPADLDGAVAAATGGAGADLALDAVGTGASRQDSLRILRAGGTAVWLGMHAPEATIPAFDVVVREQRVVGSFAYTDAEFGRALGLLERGLVVPAVSTRSTPLAGSGDRLQRLVDGALDGVAKDLVRCGLV